MDRRRFLQTAAVTGASLFAGCSTISSVTGQSRMEWEWQSNVYLETMTSAAVVVTGTLENTGDATCEQYFLQAEFVDSSGVAIATREKVYEEIAPGEEQEFFFNFSVTEREAEQAEDFHVRGKYPDGTYSS